jgi:hypothetical protein
MANDDRVRLWAQVNQDLPGTNSNNSYGPLHTTRRGAVHAAPWGSPASNVCEVGQYFVATNPTAGTGVAGIAAADGINPLEHLISLYNANTAASGTRIYLDYLTLRLTAAGTNGTDLAYVHHIDSADRYTSGGAAHTEVNTNMDSTSTSAGRVHFGALVSPAASAARLLGGGVLRVVIGVVGDIYSFSFHGGGQPTNAQGIINATAPVSMHTNLCPVVIGPGDSWLFQTNATSQTGAISWEYELGWWEL